MLERLTESKLGEIAAAFAAGYITANEAITIAYYRGLAASKSSLKGAMIAVGLDEVTAFHEISKLGVQERARIVCINSPESVTISGESDAIQQLLIELQDRGIFARNLKTDGMAYHSHHMAEVGQYYEDNLSKCLGRKEEMATENVVLMYSSLTGDLLDSSTARTPGYWRTNLESPVLFRQALESLLLEKYHLIEIGPHSALQLPIKQITETWDFQKILLGILQPLLEVEILQFVC